MFLVHFLHSHVYECVCVFHLCLAITNALSAHFSFHKYDKFQTDRQTNMQIRILTHFSFNLQTRKYHRKHTFCFHDVRNLFHHFVLGFIFLSFFNFNLHFGDISFKEFIKNCSFCSYFFNN